MDSAQPVPAVNAKANNSSKKPVRAGDSFARALGEGLVDVAFAFDGAFRSADSMSLAVRAAYGLRSSDEAVAYRIASAPQRRVAAKSPDSQLVPGRAQRPVSSSSHAIGCIRNSDAVPTAPVLEEVRREARLRHASSSAVQPNRAHQNRSDGCQGLRAYAKVGTARLDVIVTGGGRLASVMQWTR